MNQADLSNTEQFDKAILTLSSSGLGLSIAVIQFIVPLAVANFVWLLWASWILFASAIVVTVVSFMTTSRAIKDTRYYAYQYYLNSEEKYADKVSPFSVITHYLNRISGIVFILAISSTVAFVVPNLSYEGMSMNDKNGGNLETGKRGYVPPPVDPAPKKPEKPQEQTPDKGSSTDKKE